MLKGGEQGRHIQRRTGEDFLWDGMGRLRRKAPRGRPTTKLASILKNNMNVGALHRMAMLIAKPILLTKPTYAGQHMGCDCLPAQSPGLKRSGQNIEELEDDYHDLGSPAESSGLKWSGQQIE